LSSLIEDMLQEQALGWGKLALDCAAHSPFSTIRMNNVELGHRRGGKPSPRGWENLLTELESSSAATLSSSAPAPTPSTRSVPTRLAAEPQRAKPVCHEHILMKG
jgi:hypothetical protein